MHFTLRNSLAILTSICTLSISAVCWKLSAETIDVSPFWSMAYFVTGLIAGLLFSAGATIAMRNNNPNLVYAMIGGPGAVALHLTLVWVFDQSLLWQQWVAILLIVIGAVLLQVRRRTVLPRHDKPHEVEGASVS